MSLDIPWNDIKETVSDIQAEVCIESFVLHHVVGSPSSDGVVQEPLSLDPVDITIDADVKKTEMDPKSKDWGQRIGADYVAVCSVDHLIEKGINVLTPATRELLARDKATVRGYPCSVLKTRLSGKYPDGYYWLTFGFKLDQ